MADVSALLGTWRMVSWTREVTTTGETSDAMGPNPIGYIAYHADGRMMALVLKRDRPTLSGVAPTDEEKVKLFDTMLAYSATYTVEDDRVIHHVDAAWNPAWVGDLIRPYTLDGDALVISGARQKTPPREKRSSTGSSFKSCILRSEFTGQQRPSEPFCAQTPDIRFS